MDLPRDVLEYWKSLPTFTPYFHYYKTILSTRPLDIFCFSTKKPVPSGYSILGRNLN